MLMKNKAICTFIEELIILSLLILIYYSGIKRAPFHPDESQWIATSYVFEDYFSGNFTSPHWNELGWTVDQPPLPRYLIGFGRWIGGIGDSELNKPRNFSVDFSTNSTQGRLPIDQLLFWSRFPMGMLAVISIFMGYIILKIAVGKFPAYIWLGLCFISTYFLSTLSRAMAESSLLACIVAIMLITYKLLKISEINELIKSKQFYIYFLVLGFVIGLAGSSKLNGASALAAGFVLSIVIAFKIKQSNTAKIRILFFSMLILMLSSFTSFVTLNPYLWPDPLNRASRMLFNRIYIMSVQEENYPESKIEGLDNRIVLISNAIFQKYAAIDSNDFFIMNIIFSIIGFSFLSVKSSQYLKNLHSNPAPISILMVCVATSFPPLLTPLNWDRYYLIPIFFSTIFIAIGIWWSLYFLYNFFSKLISKQRFSIV